MTSPEITIVDTTPAHLREMAIAMHTQTAETAERLGMKPGKALWRSYKQSLICKTIFINGKIAAIFGLGGVMMGDTGLPWLVMTPEVDNHPFRVAFRYRKELEKMQAMFPVLQDFVDEANTKAVRMLELMGFTIGDERIKVNYVNLRRAERRA
jgi:hypothetical protein